MKNQEKKDKLIKALKEMELQGSIISVVKTSLNPNDNYNESYDITDMSVMNDDEKFCLYNNDSERSVQLGFDKLKHLSVSRVESLDYDEEDGNSEDNKQFEIFVGFTRGNIRWNIYNYLM